MPDERRNSRPVGGGEGTNYRDAAVWTGAGGPNTLHLLWLLDGPLLVGEPKNCFTGALPAVGVPGHLGTDPVSVYIQVSPHSIASSPYLQLLTNKPYIKETH